MEKFEKLGLDKSILKIVKELGFEKPSEIQEKSIPLVLDGEDIIAGSATGSGKTLAFGVGMLQSFESGRGVQGLVLTPTRELAEQVANALERFSTYKRLEIVPVYGGVSIENQIKKLAYADIIVATPGRLLDHLERNTVSLDKVKILVLDEADRMWDMGFKDDVAKIVRKCPDKKQTLLFSATISSELADFSSKFMKSPIEVAVESYVDASKLKQVYYDAPDDLKFSLLVHLLKHEDAKLVMIFCNTRRNVTFLEKNLQRVGIEVYAIHGGLTQSRRTSILKDFHSRKVHVLVCTDVAARGLDIKGVSHVYNYDAPADARDYVHRIGRTARAGKEGKAVNILTSRDYDNFSNVQKFNSELKIEREEMPFVERMQVQFDRTPQRGNFRRGFNRDSRGNSGRNFSRRSSSNSRNFRK